MYPIFNRHSYLRYNGKIKREFDRMQRLRQEIASYNRAEDRSLFLFAFSSWAMTYDYI